MRAQIYLDAVGRADDVRTWGALAALGHAGKLLVVDVMGGARLRNQQL